MKCSLTRWSAIRVALFYFTFAGLGHSIPAQPPALRFRLIRDSVIVVPVMADGQGPFEFILDTGATSTRIDTRVARRLSLAASDPLTLITVAGERTVVRASIHEVSLGSANSRDLEVLVEDLSAIRKIDSRIAGILGQNFLRQFNYLIDYQRRNIRVEESDEILRSVKGFHTPADSLEGMMLVPADLESGRGTVQNRAKLRLLLDTGANYLTLFHGASLGLESMSAAGGWTSNTGSERARMAAAKVGSLIVGQQQFKNFIAVLPTVAVTQDRVEDGVLPASFFHSIYINNREQFVVLNPDPK